MGSVRGTFSGTKGGQGHQVTVLVVPKTGNNLGLVQGGGEKCGLDCQDMSNK